MLRALDRIVGTATAAGLVLVIPLSLLLFLQWPLRDWLGRYSREANDCAQILFAFYASLAVSYTTRQHAHLAADSFARRYSAATRLLLARLGALLVLVPFAVFILYAAWPSVQQSVMQWEGFPETFNPGYWLIKLAGYALAGLVLLQAILDVFGTKTSLPRDSSH